MNENKVKMMDEEDEKMFNTKFDEPDEHELNESINVLKSRAEYLINHIPDRFITRELLFNLDEIESISSDFSSISADELEELENMHDDLIDDEIKKKTIRDLYYELIIEKNFDEKAKKIDKFIDITANDDGVDIRSDADLDENDDESSVNVDEDDFNEKPVDNLLTIMDSDEEDFDIYQKKDHLAFISDVPVYSYVSTLLGDDIECPDDENEIKDGNGCKSLKTIFEELQSGNESTYCALHAITLLFMYNNRELNDNEVPIEQEITDTINNLNNNTIKPADELYSQIKGCVVVSKGLGILILEISMFDIVRILNSVRWSSMAQTIITMRVLSNVCFIKSRFSFFMTCRAYFDENDTRTFPDPEKLDKRIERNDKKYLSRVQKYLGEISNKIGYTISLMSHQAKTHLCGIVELPPCAAEHLPSVQLIEWSLKIPYLKRWSDLVDDYMVPDQFYDHTQDSYPAGADMFNLRNLYIMDEFKDYLPLFYRNGFRPKFNESILPQIIVPEVCRTEAEEVFKDKPLIFIENKDEQRNFNEFQ
ncbi:hypothetical protein O3M35_003011 [Rhynocoris fuscipes]|uniref:Uncharacterized protein n=1 Tax=Rhynocoris fuscipes TaxID=488301 RepID=A0AAW1CIN4_9HEMI